MYLQVFPILINIVQSQDVRVFYQLHDGDLSLHFLQDALRQLVLVDDLDGDLLAQDAMRPQFDQTWKKMDKGMTVEYEVLTTK